MESRVIATWTTSPGQSLPLRKDGASRKDEKTDEKNKKKRKMGMLVVVEGETAMMPLLHFGRSEENEREGVEREGVIGCEGGREERE